MKMRFNCRSAAVLAAILLAAGISGAADTETPRTMFVDGPSLYDRCGEKVVLRGVNAMIVYWDRSGENTYPEVAKTGANVCRIFWTVKADAGAAALDRTIANCRKAGMIPMPCVWDATGKWDQFEKCVDFWCRPEIVKVLQKHEAYVLVNIANEAGNGSVTNEQYRKAYRDALVRMRAAGLHMPLVIDAANWGRGERYIHDNGRYLLEQDPDHNVIFSWHPWDTNQPVSRYHEAIDKSIEQGLCMIVGEFSHLGVFYKEPIDYQTIMKYCDEKDVGWLAWVWWCCKEDYDGHTISADKSFGHWANDPWGREVTVESPYGIRQTSKKPYSLLHGECRPVTPAGEDKKPREDAKGTP